MSRGFEKNFEKFFTVHYGLKLCHVNSGDKELQMATWNSLWFHDEFAREDFSEEEQYTESRHFLIEGCGYEGAKIYELTPKELAEDTL